MSQKQTKYLMKLRGMTCKGNAIKFKMLILLHKYLIAYKIYHHKIL